MFSTEDSANHHQSGELIRRERRIPWPKMFSQVAPLI